MPRTFKFHWRETIITGTLHEALHTFLIISRSFLLRIRNISEIFVEKIQNTFYVQKPFSENRAFCEIMWKQFEEVDRPQLTWRAHIACRIPTATNRHSQYLIVVIFNAKTVVARKSLNVTLHVHCLCVIIWHTLFLSNSFHLCVTNGIPTHFSHQLIP